MFPVLSSGHAGLHLSNKATARWHALTRLADKLGLENLFAFTLRLMGVR